MTLSKKNISDLHEIFAKFPAIKLVYLFGSQATGKVGPLSDYDFAFYLDEKDFDKRYKIELSLYDPITKLFKTDNVDIVILNDIEMPELKYHIIKDGKLIYEKEPYKIILEPRILNEYFDFYYTLKKYGLTKA